MADALLEKYDIYYVSPSGSKLGMMLAKSKGVKLWRRQDERGLPDSFAPGDIGYANLSPDVQKVIAQEYLHGGLGTLKHGTSEDVAFNEMRYLRTQDVDLRCKGKAYPGPKIVSVTKPANGMAWATPAGASVWSSATNVKDNNLTTFAYAMAVPAANWSAFLEITQTAANCLALRIYRPAVNSLASGTPKVDIDAFYGETWNHIYEGEIDNDAATWLAVSLGGIQSVDKFKVSIYNPDTVARDVRLYEADFGNTNGSVGATLADAVFNDKCYKSFGSLLAKLNGAGTAYDPVIDLGQSITHLEAFGDYLYIALAAANKYWYMSTAEAFTESTITNGEADQFCKVGTNFYQLKLPNKIRKATGGDPTNAGGWDAEITVGEAAYNVNDLIEYASVLYCLKEEGPYYIDSSGNVFQPFPELASIAHADSGENSVVAFNKLYFRMGNQQVFEIDSSMLTEITPSAFSQGISQYTYACVAFAHDEAWLYALMYRGANDVALLAGRWEYVAGLTRWIWHDIRKLTGITNASCAFVSSVEGRPYLYIGSTVAGEQVQKLYVPITNDATADSDYRFATSGSLWTPRYTTALTAFTKRWDELFARSKNLTGANYITVTQSVDDGANFTALGVLNDSPEKTLEYSSVKSTMMNLLFAFTGDSETVPPVLIDFNLKAITLVPSVVRFSHAVKCDSGLLLKKNIRSKATQTEIIAFIDTLRDDICTLGDPFGNEHTVRVRVPDERIVFDEDDKKPVLVSYIEATSV